MSVILPQTGPTEGRTDTRHSRSSAHAVPLHPANNDAFARLMSNEQLPSDSLPPARDESGIEMDPNKALIEGESRSAKVRNGDVIQAGEGVGARKEATDSVEILNIAKALDEAALGEGTDRQDQLVETSEMFDHRRLANHDPLLADPGSADSTIFRVSKLTPANMQGEQPKKDHTSSESSDVVNKHSVLSTAEMALRHEAGDLQPVRSGGVLASNMLLDMSAVEMSMRRPQTPNPSLEDAENNLSVAPQKADVTDRLVRNLPDVVIRATAVVDQNGRAGKADHMNTETSKPNVYSENDPTLPVELLSKKAKLAEPENRHKRDHFSNVSQTSPVLVGQHAHKLLKELPRDSFTASADLPERVGGGAAPDNLIDNNSLLGKPAQSNVTAPADRVQISNVGDVLNPLDSKKPDADREMAPLFAGKGEQLTNYSDARSFQAVQSAPSTSTSPAVWSNANGTPRVLQDMTVTLTEAQDILEVSLKPDELGRLSIRLDTNGAGTVVFVMADRAETQGLVRRHIEMLHQQLSDMGFENLSFEFEHGDENDTGGDQQKDLQLGAPTATEIGPAPQVKQVSIATSGLDIRI